MIHCVRIYDILYILVKSHTERVGERLSYADTLPNQLILSQSPYYITHRLWIFQLRHCGLFELGKVIMLSKGPIMPAVLTQTSIPPFDHAYRYFCVHAKHPTRERSRPMSA